jgi:cell division protein FtsN
MAQAKRKHRASPASRKKYSYQGLGMLLVGMVIGSLATILWQGMKVADGGVGTGIRQMIDQSRDKDQEEIAQQSVSVEDRPVEQQTNFDFFTVLPEIEVVVPPSETEPIVTEPQKETSQAQTGSEKPAVASSAYMLQAGSYKNKSDADRLKAELALKGQVSSIQKVSIQGKGDFYRVRLGPYLSYEEMAKADQSLLDQGLKTLRLKISKGG